MHSCMCFPSPGTFYLVDQHSICIAFLNQQENKTESQLSMLTCKKIAWKFLDIFQALISTPPFKILELVRLIQ